MAVSVAILLPILIGFAGIGVEIGLWFAIQRQNQSAADAAAISAGLEYAAQIESGAATNPTAAATPAAGYNLFSTNPPNTLTLYPCYGFTVGTSCNTSSSNGALNAVQVALIQPLNTTFANIVTAIWGPNINIVNVTISAIAAFPMLRGGQTCLLALGSGNPPTGSLALGSGNLNLPNCSLASLSTSGNSIQVSGSVINAAAVATAGNILTDSGSNPPNTGTYLPLQDPYKSVTIAKPTGACKTDPNYTLSTLLTLNPGFYCGLTFSSTANVILQPGVYYLDGGNFSVTGLTAGSNIRGAGVTIVLTKISASSAGGIDIDPGAACSGTVSLSSPLSGQGLLPPSPTASQRLLFFQDPTAVGPTTPPSNILTTGATNANCTVALNGAVYTPKSADTLQGNALVNGTGCTEFIAQSFSFTGNPQIDNIACSGAGITLNQAQIQQVYLAM